MTIMNLIGAARRRVGKRPVLAATAAAACVFAGVAPATGTAAAASTPRSDILVLGVYRPPTGNIGNVYITASDAFVSDGVEELVTEPLFYENYQTGVDQPWLATGFKYSNGYKTLTIYLRKGAYWNDGVPFTSADVVYSMDQIISTHPTPWRAGNIQATVASAKALGPYTVQLTLKAPSPRFIYTDLSSYVYTSNFTPLPEHIFKGQNFKTFSDFDLKTGLPLGTGPYSISAVGPESVTLTRNDNWWAVKAGLAKLPAPEEVIFTNPGSEDSVVSELESNQLDYVGEANITVPGFLTAEQHNPKIQNWNGLLGYTDPCPYTLTINTNQAPWNNAQMRWALSYAINKTELARLFNSPAPATPAATPFPAFPQLDTLLNQNAALLKQYPTDTYSLSAEAKILQSQGYKLEGGKWVGSNGQPLSISISIFSAAILGDTWTTASELIQQQLATAGITATMQPGDWNVLIAAQGSNGKPTFGAQTWFECGSVTDPWATFNIFSNSPSSANPPDWTDAQYDSIVAQMGQTAPGSPKITSQYSQALKILLQQLPVIPLMQRPDPIVTNTTYWTGWPTSKDPYTQPYPWTMNFHQVILHLQPAR
jgi:peptide/nickel transport system substrate-binding protein